ncbi:MAG: HD domain-containing protein [Candidatus Lokiarchaeota archaeon]|nr:HD domain-containing protein [Candidatus Lokiarchaeota archaeon]
MGLSEAQMKNYRKWFKEYCKSFTKLTSQQSLKIELKIKHSYKVAECIEEIGDSIGLSEQDKRIAEFIALFHDLGRFEQVRRFDTFSDAESMDHGDYAVEILKEFKLLEPLNIETQTIIYKSIKYHNKFKLPLADRNKNQFSEREILFIKLIRDADKIDIFRVIMETFFDHSKDEANKILINLRLEDEISTKVFNDFINDKIISKSDIKYLNDYKILILSWIHDLNFPRTIQLFVEKNYFMSVANTLPDCAAKTTIIKKINETINIHSV